MKISEVFTSVQGEGMLAGVPSVFIRTTGCNLRCVWCDTPYTSWNPEGREVTIAELAARAQSARHVVITGGEPMIAPEIGILTRCLRSAGKHITIETAGTVFAEVECDLMSISPKLANSTPYGRDGGRWAERHERLRFQPEALRSLMAAHPYQLKFVITAEEDVREALGIAEQLGADRERVCLMPEGTQADTLRSRGTWLWEVCVREGVRYSPRLHVDLFGDRRGV